MRIMCLDMGEKRIGIAISDKTKLIAQNLTTLNRENLKDDLEKLKDIAEKNEVNLIVIGLPLNMNGTLGKQAKQTLKFKKLIEEKLAIKIDTYDERLSSKEAENVLIKADVSRKKRRKMIDKISAQVILQGYLDSRSRHETNY